MSEQESLRSQILEKIEKINEFYDKVDKLKNDIIKEKEFDHKVDKTEIDNRVPELISNVNMIIPEADQDTKLTAIYNLLHSLVVKNSKKKKLPFGLNLYRYELEMMGISNVNYINHETSLLIRTLLDTKNNEKQ